MEDVDTSAYCSKQSKNVEFGQINNEKSKSKDGIYERIDFVIQ